MKTKSNNHASDRRRRLLITRAVTGITLLCVSGVAHAQRSPAQIGRLIQDKLLVPEVTAAELQEYALRRLPRLPAGPTRESWTAEARQLRERYLRDVVYHGWPDAWVNAPLRVDDAGLIPTGADYRLRKLRLEIVPGFYCAALLYEPARLEGRVPAVLNVNGHDRAGKAAEYKQKRCINQALRGMLALNIDFIGFGELEHPENAHQTWGPHLDLVGANAVGLFYLAMRKGLDYLDAHPQVDRRHIAVTGLSGGGWQTSVLSGLDERVTVAIPVAGSAALRSAVEAGKGIGDVEQTPTDMQTVLDYAHLTAMRAPKPTLMIYNAEDDCCFRAALVKPSSYDEVQPFFRLYSAEDNFAWHLNVDPGYHNYQQDNRERAYRFLMEHFGLSGSATEIAVDGEVRTSEELRVGLPADNLTILGLARKLAERVERTPTPESHVAATGEAGESRAGLSAIVREPASTVATAFALTNSYNRGIETISYRFRFDNGLSASAVWIKQTSTPAGAPATIVVHDKGRGAAGAEVFERIFRGEQVVVVNPLFIGDAELPSPGNANFARLLYTLGDRPLGVQSAQLHALAGWLQRVNGAKSVRLEANGMRTQVIAVVAAALHPGVFQEVVIRDGMTSLRSLLEIPVKFETAPELFCLDLYRRFDLDRLAQMSAPTKVTNR